MRIYKMTETLGLFITVRNLIYNIFLEAHKYVYSMSNIKKDMKSRSKKTQTISINRYINYQRFNIYMRCTYNC